MKNFNNIMALAGKPCACGRIHHLSTNEIVLKAGALTTLPGIIRRLIRSENRKAFVVCDENTYKAAGARVESLLKENTIPFDTLVFKNGVIADESAVARFSENSDDSSFFLAVGSGTIHDICRYSSAHEGKPFISVPTAPSMDGFVSSVAAMTFNGCKVTAPAVPPVAVVADTDVLSGAPRELVNAGAGDILGKFTCLCDWETASLVSDEPYCSALVDLERTAATDVLSRCGELRNGGADATESLMYALLASGIAMQLNGNSRPASGAEHHLSHFWEMRFLSLHRKPVLHGTKVGAATVIIADLYKKKARKLLLTDFRTHIPELNKSELERVFGNASGEILKENSPDPFAQIDLPRLYANRSEIVRVIDRAPDPKIFREALKTLGAPIEPYELGIEDAMRDEGIKYCLYIRRRLTLLRILSILK